jgi:hypothetical protein
MASVAICLDQNQNTVACSDPSCTYGDCGSTGPQQLSGSLCLDQNQNQIACSDPNCTYGDCTASPTTSLATAVGVSASGATGSAGMSNNVLQSPSAGGSVAGLNPTVVSSIGSIASAISNVVSPPPKTSLTLGASGLNLSSAGSLFSNPLMLGLLAVIAFLLFWGFRKTRA